MPRDGRSYPFEANVSRSVWVPCVKPVRLVAVICRRRRKSLVQRAGLMPGLSPITRAPARCPRCAAQMKEVVTIAQLGYEPGLVAYRRHTCWLCSRTFIGNGRLTATLLPFLVSWPPSLPPWPLTRPPTAYPDGEAGFTVIRSAFAKRWRLAQRAQPGQYVLVEVQTSRKLIDGLAAARPRATATLPVLSFNVRGPGALTSCLAP
jgi:hypothetical protein